jgi:hypothetical protein
MLALSLVCLGGMLFGPLVFPANGMNPIPVSLHSVLRADYSADAAGMVLPAVGIGLIENAIEDQQQATDAPEQLSTIISGLLTAVPTVTPQFPFSPTTSATARVTPTRGVSWTATAPPSQPTHAPLPSLTPSATLTATPTASLPPRSTSTPRLPTPTDTSVPRPTDPPPLPTQPPQPTDPVPYPPPPKPTDPPSPTQPPPYP